MTRANRGGWKATRATVLFALLAACTGRPPEAAPAPPREGYVTTSDSDAYAR